MSTVTIYIENHHDNFETELDSSYYFHVCDI